MGTYLNPIEQLEHRIKMIEQRVNNLETVGKPKYGRTNERAELPIHIVIPSLLDLNLKQMRKNKGLTLRQVEEKIGVSNGYLSQLETGKIKSPGYDTIKRLIELYCNEA